MGYVKLRGLGALIRIRIPKVQSHGNWFDTGLIVVLIILFVLITLRTARFERLRILCLINAVYGAFEFFKALIHAFKNVLLSFIKPLLILPLVTLLLILLPTFLLGKYRSG